MQITIDKDKLLYDIESMISRFKFELEYAIDNTINKILNEQIEEQYFPWYKKLFFHDKKILDNYCDIKSTIYKEINSEKIFNINRFYYDCSRRYHSISNSKAFKINKKLKKLIMFKNMIDIDVTTRIFIINEDDYKLIYEM